MKIEDYRLSDLGSDKVEKLIKENECTIFEVVRNRFGDIVVNTKDDVCTCGSIIYGKCIQYDGLPTIPFSQIKDHLWRFICKKKESREVYNFIKEWLKTVS